MVSSDRIVLSYVLTEKTIVLLDYAIQMLYVANQLQVVEELVYTKDHHQPKSLVDLYIF
jgi:hypothetical protein